MKKDLSKISTDDLLLELYSRNDVWLVQHYRPHHIQELSSKKISLKKAKEILETLASGSFCFDDQISHEVSELIQDIINNK